MRLREGMPCSRAPPTPEPHWELITPPADVKLARALWTESSCSSPVHPGERERPLSPGLVPSVGSHRALQPGRGGSPPLFTCTEGLTQRSQGAAGEGCSEGEVQAARRQTWRRGATQVARHCPRPPDAAQGPRQARRTRNPLLRALMAIRWPEWKITRSPGPSLELAAARLLRTACGEEESASAPPPPPREPAGSWGGEPEPGGVQAPQGWHEGRGGRSGFPGGPGESPPALGRLSHGPGSPRECRALLSRGANGAQGVCVGASGASGREPKAELPLHLLEGWGVPAGL